MFFSYARYAFMHIYKHSLTKTTFIKKLSQLEDVNPIILAPTNHRCKYSNSSKYFQNTGFVIKKIEN